jgi:PIN domain nuclease of toxin-antitoxin system
MVESGQVYLSVISYWEVVLKGSKGKTGRGRFACVVVEVLS